MIEIENFNKLMLAYFDGTASRDERITLLEQVAESEEAAFYFNSFMALQQNLNEDCNPTLNAIHETQRLSGIA